MGHIQQRSCGIALNSHIFRLGQTDQWPQSARTGNLGLVLLVGGQVGDTAYCIALDLDIGRDHLSY